jgi:hypothetical protein
MNNVPKPDWDIMDTFEKFVFVSSNDRQGSLVNSYSTFSALFTSILSVNYVQPWFGGNYIEIAFKPTPDGGLPVSAIATAQLRTDGRGLYEFSATMQHSMEVARRKQQEASTLRELMSQYAETSTDQVSLHSRVYTTKEQHRRYHTAIATLFSVSSAFGYPQRATPGLHHLIDLREQHRTRLIYAVRSPHGMET